MSTIPIGSTDSARRAQAVIVVDRATGEPAAAGGGAGTSDTTEATQLLVRAAVETTATNSTALAKSEDAAHASGDKGIMALVVRKDTAAALAGADGDYAPLEVDASGRLWVNVGTMAALPAGSNAIGSVVSAGNVAHDAADSGNPLKVGGKAYTGAPSAVADADRVDQAMTLRGAAHVSMRREDGTAVDPDTPAVIDSGVKFVDVTLSTDTAAYASGDLIADTQIIAACVRSNDATGLLSSIEVVDEDNQGVALSLLFFSGSASLGTENAAPTYTDAIIRTLLYRKDVAGADYAAYGSVAKVAQYTGINVPITPVASSDDIYVAVVNGSGTPTFTASGLKLRLGFLI